MASISPFPEGNEEKQLQPTLSFKELGHGIHSQRDSKNLKLNTTAGLSLKLHLRKNIFTI